MSDSKELLKDTAALYGTNFLYIRNLYIKYLNNPESLDESWVTFFDKTGDNLPDFLREKEGPSWSTGSGIENTLYQESESESEKGKAKKDKSGFSTELFLNSIKVLRLINAYKLRGDILASLDPLNLSENIPYKDLDYKVYGITEEDMLSEVYLGGVLGFETVTIEKVIETLQKTYTGNIGFEFAHIPFPEQVQWLEEKIRVKPSQDFFSKEEKKEILENLIEVEEFQSFLHKKFPGAKRFSIEGGESSIIAMERIIKKEAFNSVQEVVMGMAHRGRLSVLTKIMGRRYAALISEFKGKQVYISEEDKASGDVKYHQGASNDRYFGNHKVHLSLTPNPSHLEAVNSVVAGKVRAKQDFMDDTERCKAMGVLVHGDASFSGQGIVMESLMLSDLVGYKTGGIIHIIINNQIGFTTNPSSARTSPYPTDVAKSVNAPIFHVNGDDMEAVAFVSDLASEFRNKFKKDVVIDIFCYRRHGHNEGDEPLFTQPLMYEVIKKHPVPGQIYKKYLLDHKVFTSDEIKEMEDSFKNYLEEEFKISENYKSEKKDWLKGRWDKLIRPEYGVKKDVDTGVEELKLKAIGTALASYPEDHKIHRKLVGIMDAKNQMMKTGKDINWAMGEALAYGTLLSEGYHVRLSGQDSMRGTFSHRHSGLVDQGTEKIYYPLNNLGVKQAKFEVINSNLSEYGVLGFEYGYSISEPHSLVIWEAQFGDFVNGTQIVIDQFISSGETKWLRFSGLVMLLPHGYEGQGPEHTSGRMERFLQLCAEDNMQIVNCTTPANFFHVLRRQMHNSFRKPLIVFSPKSLLRHKMCVSDIEEFYPGNSFKRIIDETEPEKLVDKDKIKRVIICSGKIYYELLDLRNQNSIKDIVIIRLEQYYPFPKKELAEKLKDYKNAEVIWCQEEAENMGAWFFLDRRIEKVLMQIETKSKRPVYIGRKAAASPAAGYLSIHQREQSEVVRKALLLD